LDVEKAKQILEEDHYGMKNVKERILEYIAGKLIFNYYFFFLFEK